MRILKFSKNKPISIARYVAGSGTTTPGSKAKLRISADPKEPIAVPVPVVGSISTREFVTESTPKRVFVDGLNARPRIEVKFKGPIAVPNAVLRLILIRRSFVGSTPKMVSVLASKASPRTSPKPKGPRFLPIPVVVSNETKEFPKGFTPKRVLVLVSNVNPLIFPAPVGPIAVPCPLFGSIVINWLVCKSIPKRVFVCGSKAKPPRTSKNPVDPMFVISAVSVFIVTSDSLLVSRAYKIGAANKFIFTKITNKDSKVYFFNLFSLIRNSGNINFCSILGLSRETK